MKSYELLYELLKINSIKIQTKKPFTWASGWKSPIYFDNRVSLSYPNIRSEIKEQLSELIKREYENVDVIAGVATAGIPQGALVADNLQKPFIYVRSKPKSHGMQNMIEGKLDDNKKIILIEDLVSTGGSSIKAVEALREKSADVLSVISIFSYGFKISLENFEKADCLSKSLFEYDDLISVALDKNYINNSDAESLREWRIDPEKWGERFL
tara:strand:- start:3904 stop:4539 length:636 start_codon:yes stop_codon:yes gene_type:complete